MYQNSQYLIFKNRKLKVLEPLGQGNYGTVWKVEDDKTKEIFALKIQSYLDEREQQIIETLSKFSHRNIVNILGFEKINDKCFCILMECCNQSLFERIQKQVYDQKELRYILVSIADGLKLLHTNNIIHRDLKPENIMIKTISDSRNPKNTQELYKIADFGLSTNKDVNQTFQVGTCYYMAPELIKNQPYTNLVDIWSLGAISYELITNEPLFNGNSQNEILQQIANFEKQEAQNLFNKKIEIIKQDQYQYLIKRMLQPDPGKRINIDDVKQSLRNQYSSPPKIQPLFQPKIEQPKTKFFNQISYEDDKKNKRQIEFLLNPIKFNTPNQKQDFNQPRQNNFIIQQKSTINAEQEKVNQQSQIINANKSLQSPRGGFTIQNGSPNFQQNFSAIYNQNGVIKTHNNQLNQMQSVIPNQQLNAIISPHSPQRMNPFNFQDLKVKSKTPENNLNLYKNP